MNKFTMGLLAGSLLFSSLAQAQSLPGNALQITQPFGQPAGGPGVFSTLNVTGTITAGTANAASLSFSGAASEALVASVGGTLRLSGSNGFVSFESAGTRYGLLNNTGIWSFGTSGSTNPSFQVLPIASADRRIQAVGGVSGSSGSGSLTTNAGDAVIGAASGNVRVGTGSVPTIAIGACGTGSNGTVTATSRSNAGQINIGAAATTVCTVVFATAMTTAPFCVISASDAAAIGATALPYVSANTMAGFVITGTILANASFNYICL